jgi:hypothetical protein
VKNHRLVEVAALELSIEFSAERFSQRVQVGERQVPADEGVEPDIGGLALKFGLSDVANDHLVVGPLQHLRPLSLTADRHDHLSVLDGLLLGDITVGPRRGSRGGQLNEQDRQWWLHPFNHGTSVARTVEYVVRHRHGFRTAGGH